MDQMIACKPDNMASQMLVMKDNTTNTKSTYSLLEGHGRELIVTVEPECTVVEIQKQTMIHISLVKAST